MEMVGQLRWNTGNNTYFTEFHSENIWKSTMNFEGDWFLPMREHNVNDGMKKICWQQCKPKQVYVELPVQLV
jgi:hypothetical protein